MGRLPRLIEIYGLDEPSSDNATQRAEAASVSSLYTLMAEDSRQNIKKLLLKPKPLKLDDNVANHVADVFHEIDVTHSFPLAKAFILWAREHGAGEDQVGGAAQDEPFRNVPHQGPQMLDPQRLMRLSRRSSEMQQFMREVGHGLLDSLKARANVMPGLVNKAQTLDDITKALAKYQKREVKDDKLLMKLQDGWSWVRIDCEEDRRREGEEMQHCATDSRGDLISLRDQAGKPHVTMTYNLGTNTVHQIKGKQNREPEKKYWPALEAIFAEKGIKLKDRYLSADLKDALSKHHKKVVLVKTPVGNWVEITDGLYGLVSAELGVEVSAQDALVTVDMVDSDYSNDFKAVNVRQQMSGAQFMVAMQALLDKMSKVTLDLSKVNVGNLTDDGDQQLTAALDALIAAGKVSLKRKIKSLGAGAPIVARVQLDKSSSESRALFDDSSKLLFMKPRAVLIGRSKDGQVGPSYGNTTRGMIVYGLKDVTPGSAADGIERLDGVIAALNSELETNKLIFGFEFDSWVGQEGGPLVKDLMPKTFSEMAVKPKKTE